MINDQFESYSIDRIQVRTPKNIKVSREYMEKVIESLKQHQNAILEHVNGKGRLFSLLCPALAWLKHRKDNSTQQENLERIRIVYAYHSTFDKQYLEEQLKKIDYKPKISQIKQQDNIQINDEDDLILIDQQSLHNSDLTAFQNSILIIDDADQLQDIRCLGKIEKSTIYKAVDELKELINEVQKMNMQDQTKFYQEFEPHTIEIIKKKLLQLYEKFDECKNYFRLKGHPIIKFIQDFVSIYGNKNYVQYQINCVQKNYLTCSKLAKLSKLKAFADCFKFIQIAVICYEENYYEQPNYLFKAITDQINMQDNIVEIQVKQYLTHLEKRFEKLQFQSIILSSNCILPTYLPYFHINHTFDNREYIKTVLVEIQYQSHLFKNLFMKLEKFVKSIPNGILVIFSGFNQVEQFRQYCLEQQPNFFGVIEQYKKVFWGLDKKTNEIADYIKSSEKGAILFDSYEKIFNKNYHFPGHLCKGLIVAQWKTLSQKMPEFQLFNDDIQYYQNRYFDNILGRSLLYENDKGVLIIFCYQNQIKQLKWWIRNQSTLEYDEDQIAEWFKNGQNSQNDDTLIESYYPQREQTTTETNIQYQRRTKQQDLDKEDKIVQISEHSQKIKRTKDVNKNKKTQRQKQGYSIKKQSKAQIESNNQQKQQEIEVEQQENLIQWKKDETEEKQEISIDKEKSKNAQEPTAKKKKEAQPNFKYQATMDQFITKGRSAQKTTARDSSDNNNMGQI
ncbi:unnamed protein product (macronuclear) [Paramecium tetraurelia]|uniref:Helicase ATP-binding domain-containing protein n=1 Tax=Paramecium tetraurelia TaxID=5888 RepID=A0CUR5_PARTE|nr:uncharacterized protein GSPATT00010733001 [Paramecium tetraurelia]CAK74532.1 unnamed protein product [Paramecium tetraurelia]|eukprot:XP_001441929.1 hypothetical protein (macronuclear) [Paramecium tetraurelia strain d4-2]